MKLKITQEHIDTGIPGDGKACALAQAIEPYLPPGRPFHVCYSAIEIGREGMVTTLRVPIPWPIAEYIRQFDSPPMLRSETLGPIEFEWPEFFEFIKAYQLSSIIENP